jgi:hypothetical protein
VLGWVPAAATRESAYAHLNATIPEHDKFEPTDRVASWQLLFGAYEARSLIWGSCFLVLTRQGPYVGQLLFGAYEARS